MFRIQKYQVIRKALSYELANFLFNYFLLKREAVAFMYKNNIHFESGLLGTWSDKQVPNTYSLYGDFAMDTLMMKMLPVMKKETDLDLTPTYSYARLYKKGDILARHKDRPSCEVSCTLNLGGDPWPIYMLSGKKKVEINLKPGDGLIYYGLELPHWRDAFKGKECSQLFVHYSLKQRDKWDQRRCLGVFLHVK